MIFRVALLLIAALAACAPPRPRGTPAPEGLPHVRVVESATGRTIAFDELIAAASRADMVFFGEQHDDPETHFAEFALLEGIGRRRAKVVLSLEMFERDVQPVLDGYLSGGTSEREFIAQSRPWERYATDYRALVLLARTRGWPVVASNVPRPIANAVSRRGLAALDTLSPASRAHAARELLCPRDVYYERFAEQMKAHPMGSPSAPLDPAAASAMVMRFYEAQCVKDETMGESIAAALAKAGRGAIVVHYNGAFHSDGGLGTAERARRRTAGAASIVISAIPVADLSSVPDPAVLSRGDYIVFTRAATAR